MKPQTLWQRVGRAVRDRSFIIGTILVSLFVLVAVLGPELAPYNPFMRDRIQTIDGEMQRAPIPPGSTYPLGTDPEGRDILTLLLYGARQTLVIAFVATTARLFLGLMLGTLSGWWPGSWFDRLVTTVTEFLASIPALILAMLLVFAIGIRRGQVTFILALSLVGWGEIAQIVRGHILTLRRRLFVDAARALGLSPLQTLSRHVLPNLLSTMLAMAALEMGGVLLLLGELGFVHVFIGGGGMYRDEAQRVTVHFFDVPDWGAMLGTSWRYFRSLPWLPMAPALAFFVTILGFNLFGYGLQRFIEKGRFHPSGWSIVRFLAVAGLVLWGAQALLDRTGIEAQYANLVEEFDLQRAWDDIAYLTQPELEGRPPGPEGGFQAAAYIAQEYQNAGLTPLSTGGYYQSYSTYRGQVTAAPMVEILNAEGQVVFDGAVSFDPFHPFEAQRQLGTDEHPLVVVIDQGNRMGTIPDLHSPPVLLLVGQDEELPQRWGYGGDHNYAGVLRVVPDGRVLPEGGTAPPYRSDRYMDDYPNLLIGASAAEALLAEAGLDLDELQAIEERDGEFIRPTGLSIRLQVGLAYEETPAANVIGYLPASDIRTEGRRILVMAPYTGPLPHGDTIYPGADENASGVAVMLEDARLWHEIGFEPKQTVVFAAVDSGGAEYLRINPVLPTGGGDTWTVVVLHGLGAGEPVLTRGESPFSLLARTFDDSARRFGVETRDLPGWSFFFYGTWNEPFPGYTGLAVQRPGDARSGTPADTLDHLDPGMLMRAGQTVAHYLMVLSSR